MDIRNIHSIWVEDEQSSKFHLNDPNLKILNSQVPLLSSKENIELPPLPPSSFFSYSLKDEDESAKSSNKLHKMFKKFGLNNDQSKAPVKKVKRKISTPFGFNHVSHIDNKPGATITVNQLSEIQPQEQDELDEPSQSNRTSTSAKAFCTSPQINTTTTTTTKQIPRSISNATSLSRTPSSQLFTRSASISTMATTISSKTHSKKNSIIPITNQHKHQDSSSSIENLKKLEKNQISKQCSNDYTTNDFKFPNKSKKDSINWGTPDLKSAVRQSWIYEDLSPKSMISPVKPLKRSNSISGSPSYSPYRSDINLFQNELEVSFNRDENNLNEIINSIDDFTQLINNHQDQVDEDDEFNETLASLRAAKFSRLSRLENFYDHQDPKYLSFIEEFEKIKTNDSNYTKTTSVEFHKVPEIYETDQEFEDDEEIESTPRQHHISTLLPSMIP